MTQGAVDNLCGPPARGGRLPPVDAPDHVVLVSAFITNPTGEVLLVRTVAPDGTWELPGGRVVPGETLHQALQRLVLGQTGIAVAATGVTGVYQHAGLGALTVVFRARARSGRPRPLAGTGEAAFHRLDPESVERLITHPCLRSRVLEAMRGNTVAYEAVR